jgi:hydroxymethylpyrimidine/phosphomethylpyrimidine kinase
LYFKRFGKLLPLRTALTIASSDSGGGAGIQADLKTFSALGVYGLCALSSVTAQNTLEVVGSESLSPELLIGQLRALFKDFKVDAIKIGLIGNAPNAKALYGFLREFAQKIQIVLDPVMTSASGHSFLDADATLALKELIPLGTVLTPNKFEAETLTGLKINSFEDALLAGKAILRDLKPKSVLIKGGHFKDSPYSEDVLLEGEEPIKVRIFSLPRIHTSSDHGTGCTLSSAIAAFLALGFSLSEAVSEAKIYVARAMERGLPLGKGRGPLHHFHAFYDYDREREPSFAPPQASHRAAREIEDRGLCAGPYETAFSHEKAPSFGLFSKAPRGMPFRRGMGKNAPRETTPFPTLSYPYSEKLGKLKELSPLVLCLTNFVTVTDCANALLAVGASPVMSLDANDAEELCALSKALVINIGTLNPDSLRVMKRAAQTARDKNIPMILDPVGAGATSVRKDAALTLIRDYKPALLRGNASEILSLGGALGRTQKGVDSQNIEDVPMLLENAKALSQKTGAVVAVTGKTDMAVFQDNEILLEGGSPLMTKITGSGCLLSALAGAFVGTDPQDPLGATAAALSLLKVAGERAERSLKRPGALGELRQRIFDELSLLT